MSRTGTVPKNWNERRRVKEGRVIFSFLIERGRGRRISFPKFNFARFSEKKWGRGGEREEKKKREEKGGGGRISS